MPTQNRYNFVHTSPTTTHGTTHLTLFHPMLPMLPCPSPPSFDTSHHPTLQRPRLETWRQIPTSQSQIAHSPSTPTHGSSPGYVSRCPNLSNVPTSPTVLLCSKRPTCYAIPCSTSVRAANHTARPAPTIPVAVSTCAAILTTNFRYPTLERKPRRAPQSMVLRPPRTGSFNP